MDNKIKYIDLNGLKVFAESLKQDLKNHVIELGLYQELLHRIENLELYKIVDSLPKIGDENTIYLLKNPSGSGDKNVFIEYLYNNEHGWEEIGNFTPSFDLEDYLKIENAPFEKGDAENSAVLKGGNNQVISEGGVALGADNLVGLKGFYYKYITLKAGGQTRLANVYLSKTQVSNPTINTNSGTSFKDTSIKPQNYWAVGDIVSIVNDAKYDDIATVVQVKDGLVQIEWLDGKSPFSTVKQESDLSSEDYSIYCLDKPTQGISDLGKYSFATGTDNKAINAYTEVSGKGNVVKGKFGKVWGKNNIGGYNTTTFGSGNTNLADNSLVNGTNNINEGNNSVIHGNKNKNYGKRAFIVGNENITNNEDEAAFGQYNKSNPDTKFSIGIGSNVNSRKNAFEVKENGDIYIEGFEKPVQTELTELSAEVSGLSEKIENLPTAESSVFEAKFGETTYEEIIAAYNEGKYVICLSDGIAYHLVSTKDNTAWFSSISGYTSYRAWCNTSNVWYKVSYELEGTSNKVKTINESSTDTQYPSAKAVYEALQNLPQGGDSPIEKGEAEHSAVLKGEYQGYSNKAISQTSIAIGAATTAGLKGWHYSAIDFTNNKITLSDRPTYILADSTLLNGGWSSGVPNIKVDDVISLVNDSKYDLCSKVIAVNGNVITVDSLPFVYLASDVGAAAAVLAGQFSDGYSVYIPDRPDAGIIDFGGGAFSEGGQSKASNICAHAEGLQTHAYGQYSHTEGRETKAGYIAHAEGSKTKAIGNASHAEGTENIAANSNSHAEGRYTKSTGYAAHAEGYGESLDNPNLAQGNYSHVEGEKTKALGIAAHSEGGSTVATGNFSHSEGRFTRAHGLWSHVEGGGVEGDEDNYGAFGPISHCEGYATKTYSSANSAHVEGRFTEANNMAEHACGIYNKSTKSSDKSQATQFSIGIGTSDTDRKNAFEVKQNGDIYIEGVKGRIQDKLNGGSSATPDWNAREGKAGYIKNKPFYNNVDYVINKSGEYKNVHNESNVTFNNKILFNLRDIVDNDVITIISGPPVTLEKRYESDGTTTLIIEDIGNYLSTHPIIIGDLVTIPEIFIPDTIARKSDIVVDPIVWKYLCNPCVIKNGEQVPEDLLGNQDTFKYTNRGMYIVYDEGSGSNYTIEKVTSKEIYLYAGGYVTIINGCWEVN